MIASLSGILSSGTTVPVGLRIEAWDATGGCTDLIDVARSDGTGRFAMNLDREYLTSLIAAPTPRLAFRIFINGAGFDAQNAVWLVDRQRTELRIPAVPPPPANTGAVPHLSPAPSVIRGTLRNADGTPAAGRTVRAFDRGLGTSGFVDTPLGSAVTGPDGRYELRYALSDATRLKADLIVRVDGVKTGTAAALLSPGVAAESDLISNAPTVAMVDLGLAASAAPIVSEHHAMVEALQPALARTGLALADIQPMHVDFLAAAAGLTADRARMIVDAAKLARDAAGTDAESWYALLRTGYAGDVLGAIETAALGLRERLDRASEENQFSDARESQLDAITAAIGEAAIARALPASGTTLIGTALGHALAPKEVHAGFLRAYLGRDGADDDFWDTVRADKSLGPHAGDLETTLRLHILFGGFGPALAELRTRRSAGSISSHRDLARWQDGDWQAFLAAVGTPPGTPGTTPAAKAVAYGAALAAVVRSAFPTEYLRGRAVQPATPLALKLLPALAAANPELDLRQPLPDDASWGAIAPADRVEAAAEWTAFRKEARSFRGVDARLLLASTVAGNGINPLRTAAHQVLVAATSLDLENTTVDQYLGATPGALAAVAPEHRIGVVAYLQSLQRVVRLVARPEAAETLIGDGVDSALRVARMSRAQFSLRYQEVLGGSDRAEAAYSRAFRAAATSQLALTTVAQSLAGTGAWAERGGSTDKFPVPDYGAVLGMLQDKAQAKDSATWPKLFGEDSWCDCDECQSAWGPAAYFVDLLHMLDPEHHDNTAATHLFKRRPDLEYLPLTCANTNTPIPTIDLANEILEIRAAGFLNVPVTTKSYDSTGVSAEVLRAVPQHVIDGVYSGPADQPSLATAVHPFTLPFHRPLAVVRTYLDQIGVSYRELVSAFGLATSPDQLSHAEQVAAEELGLSARLFQVIADLAPDVQLDAAYGYANQPAWRDELARVPTLLARAGITYDQLYALVWTYFISPAAIGARPYLDVPVQCQIDDTKLHVATDDPWNRMHRFIRLWRATPWSIEDLDRVLYAVGTRDPQTNEVTLDRDTLRRVGEAKRAIAALDQPPSVVLSLWSDLDTWGADSVYLARFDNPTVADIDGSTAFHLAGYDSASPEHKPTTGQFQLSGAETISSHRPRVLAALGITSAELDAIFEHASSVHAIESAQTAPLALHQLTVLFRYTVLAKGLDLRISDLITLLILSGADPFVEPAATLAFVELATLANATGMTVTTLDYVFRHTMLPAQGPAPSDGAVFGGLMKIWSALRTVHQDTAIVDDPDGTLLATRLGAIQPAPIAAQIIAALDPLTPSGLREPIIATFVAPTLPTAALAIFTPADPTPPTPPLDPTNPAQQQAYETASAQYQVDVATRKRANQAALLGLVSAWLRDSLSDAATISTLASSLGLPDATARRLLVEWIPGDGEPALTTLRRIIGGGLTGHFFAAAGFVGAERIEAPDVATAQVTGDSPFHSVRWIGHLLPAADGPQRIVARTQGSGTLSVGTATISFAADTAIKDHELPVSLLANQLAAIEIEYDAGTTPGSFELLWVTPAAQTPQPVPVESLFPEGGLATLDGASGPGFVWRRAHKAALLANGLALDAEELAYAQSTDAPFGHFLVAELPMSPAVDPTQQFAAWRGLATFAALRTTLPASDTTLVAALTWRAPLARAHEWAGELAAATGWDAATIEALFETAGMTDADWAASGTAIVTRMLAALSTAPTIGERLTALATCLDLIRRCGVAPPTLRDWTAQQPTPGIANQVIQAVRAAYPDNAEWLAVATARNDTLRQLQRDALVAFLLPRMQLADPNALFEHFLIDVEMCACGQTSRIVQAISSVQLFIQRLLLGLESGLDSTHIDPAHWEWNSQYRIWQANREIFLYPENWIDPELRVDKTPFFTALQAQLAQGPLTADNVEAAYLGYLEQLEEVSRLKVCAIHWQYETSADSTPNLPGSHTIDKLHVVARTPGAHAIYYYRTLLGVAKGGGGTEWTPWEKIDLDIGNDGDTGDAHMVLTTFNRRLYMFWAQFTEVPEPTQPGGVEGHSPAQALTHWEVRIAWSTYRSGQWAAKQLTSQLLRSDRFIGDSAADHKSYKSALKEYEHERDQARSKWLKQARTVQRLEHALLVKLQKLRVSLDQIYAENVADNDVADAQGWVVAQYTVFFTAPSLPVIEQMCSNTQQTFQRLISDLFDLVGSWPEGFLDGNEQEIGDDYDAILNAREVRAAKHDHYDQLKQALDDYYNGKTNLAIPGHTRRADHTVWLSDAHATPRVYLLRHDDRSSPRVLGYFEVLSDGRSIATISDTGRLDISSQQPHHSHPDINSYAIETKGTHVGLDLDGLPNVLGLVHAAAYTHERWFHHPVTARHPRPFVIAKHSDVSIALPDRRKKHHHTKRLDWDVAVPAGFGRVAPALPVDTRANLVSTTLAPTTSAGRSEATFGSLIAKSASFGLDQVLANPSPGERRRLFRFEPLRHPYVERMIKRLERDGVAGLLTLLTQNPDGGDAGEAGGYFDRTYAPSAKYVSTPLAVHDVDFRAQGPYAQYNWELFFHAPMLIAARLATDGQYEQALDWLHYVFDPSAPGKATPDRFWKLQWFRDHDRTTDADELMTALAVQSPPGVVDRIEAQIEQWLAYPADPHRIARLRTSAYRKAVVFKYLDTLIAWGDSLFAQNTIETINQATQLYVLASHLLGPRPQHVPQRPQIAPFSYHDVRGQLDDMSDTVESMLHRDALHDEALTTTAVHGLLGINPLPVMFPHPQAPDTPHGSLVFCVPANSKLLGYFDTVDDRLFKIRNCMNLEGVVQQLPLFQPPIDPALLVRAAALGLDIASIVADLNAPLPFQRFSVMAAKANDLCGELRALGAQLQATLEKQDAEALSKLRASQETALLAAVRDVKKAQIKDAQTAKDALQKSREVTQAKFEYYASRTFMSALEQEQTRGMTKGRDYQTIAGMVISQSSQAAAVPQFDIGPTGMGVHGAILFGGANVSSMIRSIGDSLTSDAQTAATGAAIAGVMAGHERRQEDWRLQKDLATKELAQIDKQLLGADIKIAIATTDLANQELQIASSKKIEETLRTKFTNLELYQWMVGQVATTYYQAYKLAYDLAKRAERCYRYELGIASSSFIQFGYWDSLHKGLLAGEQLSLDLKRLEAAYLQNNRRDYELTRQVSLVLHDPAAFMRLRDTGSCTFVLPEELYDADYPGHYFRRLKTISLTVPCVSGPYTPINCTLTLLASSVRTSATTAGSYGERDAPNDARFSHSYGSIQSIATSHGQNDAGMFEMSFRDERYLPFEGAGAISQWRLDLPQDCNAFDFDALADIVLKISYTARDGGMPLATTARAASAAARKNLVVARDKTALQRMFRTRYEFSDAWIAFRNAAARGAASLSMILDRDRFPYLYRGAKTLTIVQLDVYATAPMGIAAFDLTLTPPGDAPTPLHLRPSHTGASVVRATWSQPGGVDVRSGADATWVLAEAAGGAPVAALRDIILVATFTAV